MVRKVSITEAREDDIPQVIELLFHLDAHVSGAPREVLKMTPQGESHLASHFRSYLENPYKLLLVARAPRAGIVGMGDIALWKNAEVWETPERKEQWYGVIDPGAWVEPDYRRQGLSRLIVVELATFARRHGVESLQLEYSASNEEAARAWKRMGFRPIGVRAGAFATDVLALLSPDENETR
ncbi:MAG: GNAT family N-acetyltransferase [Gammaproteobacteria bacterium]|nr:GNAT family N-acetyltransferase [Gammaproteobacteria bacterium]